MDIVLGRCRRCLKPQVLEQHVVQARLFDDPVALAIPMIPEVFHPGRITQTPLRSRSG